MRSCSDRRSTGFAVVARTNGRWRCWDRKRANCGPLDEWVGTSQPKAPCRAERQDLGSGRTGQDGRDPILAACHALASSKVPKERNMAHILAELAGAVGTVTLDHERRRNALSHALVEEVIAALRRFHEGKARVVILRARPGARVFSAGHDIDE